MRSIYPFNGQAAIKHGSSFCNNLWEFENCRHGVIEARPLNTAHFPWSD